MVRGLLKIAVLVLPLLNLSSAHGAKPFVHPDPHLHFIYPAGGRQGQTVNVELGGLDGLTGATGVMVEGAPGITVRDVKSNKYEVRATFAIAANAAPGRRLVRVVGGKNGLTNFRPFFVGKLPEILEKEPNNTPQKAQDIAVPAVVNGRLDPELDIDCFRFRGKAGQKIVAAVLAHRMDSMMRQKVLVTCLDTSLELLDDGGKVLATAEDTLGLDPLIHYTLKADGLYTVRIQALSFHGSRSAIYRLTIGEVPYPTHLFPAGGRRGDKAAVHFGGPNVPQGTRQTYLVPVKGTCWRSVAFDHPLTDGRELPFVAGNYPEQTQAEIQLERDDALELKLPGTVNGRFERAGQAAWYRLRLKKGEGVLLHTLAQRHLGAPVDTYLEIHDSKGAKLAENDDGSLFAGQCAGDFDSPDSWLPFKAKNEGDYFVRLSDKSGQGGPRAVYRLTAETLKPDFLLYQWPDAVPVWGPGTTASFIVQVQQWGGLTSDIEVRVEGLAQGWTGSAANVPAVNYFMTPPPYGQHVFLTITAPQDALPGATTGFRVVGRARQNGHVIEREAQYLTFYGGGHSKRRHFRFSPGAHAVVAGYQAFGLTTTAKELTVDLGETVEIPIQIQRRPDCKGPITLSVDGPMGGGAAGSGWRRPFTVPADQVDVRVPLKVVAGKYIRPGTYGIVVSRGWISDIRGGKPGPCTPVILLHVRGNKGKGKGK